MFSSAGPPKRFCFDGFCVYHVRTDTVWDIGEVTGSGEFIEETFASAPVVLDVQLKSIG